MMIHRSPIGNAQSAAKPSTVGMTRAADHGCATSSGAPSSTKKMMSADGAAAVVAEYYISGIGLIPEENANGSLDLVSVTGG